MRLDRDSIREALLDRAQDLFRELWGEPDRPGSHDWRPKDDSARSMAMRGPKRGVWYDHRSNEGGDILDFIAVHLCSLPNAAADFRAALKAAAAWLGFAGDTPVDRAALEQRQAVRLRQAEADDLRKAEATERVIAALEREAQPVAGTPAEIYLRSRGITIVPGDWHYLPPQRPQAGLLHAHRAALLLWCCDAQGRRAGGQRILLMPDGSQALEPERKPSFGAVGGNPVRIPAQGVSGALIVCESPEAAASISETTGFETWASLSASNFAALPLPTDRKVILCPDRDARDSPAARGFIAACQHHAARGVNLWIAETPAPEGSKADLNDTAQCSGSAAVATAIASATKYTTRNPSGRFTGPGATDLGDDSVGPSQVFSTPEEARALIEAKMREHLQQAAAWDPEGDIPAPVLVVAASPGTGKSTIARRLLAETTLPHLNGDPLYYTPSLALSDEAAQHSATIGGGSHVTRGRSAISPTTREPMCARSQVAEAAAKAGLNVSATLCSRKEGGSIYSCPYLGTCSYMHQWDDLPPEPITRFEAHNYLSRADGSGRVAGLRVVDESMWPSRALVVDVSVERWLRPPRPLTARSSAEEVKAAATAADMAVAARAIYAALCDGKTPVLADHSAQDFARFATAARGSGVLHSPPNASDAVLRSEIETYHQIHAGGGAEAVVWAVLADCAQRGITATERLRLVHEAPKSSTEEGRTFLRATKLSEPPRDKPVLLLDASASPAITRRLYPSAETITARLRPNATIIQVSDRTFSKNKLSQPGVRKQAAALVVAEVSRAMMMGDMRGVLIVATKQAVRWFFEDAGYDLSQMSAAEANAFMMDTPLLGARWIWFGPAALGRNDWADFGTVVSIGREELPLDTLEDFGRSVFGDTGEPLIFVQPDEHGRRMMPEVLLPVTMSDGSTKRILNRQHPDPRIAEIQAQYREGGMLQAIERLRLGTADLPKRVVNACRVPLDGLPVDYLVPFVDLMPSRLEQAVNEAARRGGVLRTSASGLAADAPETFGTVEAARSWLKGQIKWGGAGNRDTITGSPPFKFRTGHLRLAGQRGRTTPCLIVTSGDPAAIVEAQFGPGAIFEPAPTGLTSAK